jgi:hypothetical protein
LSFENIYESYDAFDYYELALEVQGFALFKLFICVEELIGKY